MRKTIIVYPTSADPPTIGHADLLRRISLRFDCVYWVVAVNLNKEPFFSMPDRLAMMDYCVQYYDLKNVILDRCSGAVAQYAKEKDASFLARGLRNATDFQLEFDMASANRGISELVETLCIFADPKFSMVSSGLVRELAILGENVDRYVIPKVAAKIKQVLKNRKTP